MKELIFLSLVTLIVCYMFTSSILHKVRKFPPSPLKLPLIGNLHQMGPLPHRSLHAMARKHGPIMLLRIGQVPFLVIASADIAAEVFKTQDHIFSTRPLLQVPTKLFYGGKNISFSNGEYWRKCKKLTILHLLSSRKVMSYKPMREEEVSRMVESVLKTHALGPIDLTDVIGVIAKQMTTRVMIGLPSGNEDWYDKIHDVIRELTVIIGSFNPGDFFRWAPWLTRITGLERRLNRITEWADRALGTIIEKRMERLRAGEREECFVDIMLNLMEESNNIDIPLGIDNIKAILMDTLGAGTEAPTIVIEWAMAELLKNPRAMKKLQAEIRSIAGSKPLVQEDDLVGTIYLKATIKEVLRLHTPGPLLLPRELSQDTTIRGYYIPRGAHVVVNAWGIGRDPKVWDAPDEFMPERFVGNPVDFKGQDFEFIPFGAGRRICPGMGYTTAMVELTVANLLFMFDWSIPDGGKAEEMNMEEVFGMSIRKKTRLYAVATPHY